MEKTNLSECAVCGQRFENWAGSTPCCGSIAYHVNQETNKATNNVPLFASIDGKMKKVTVKMTT